MPFGLDVVAIAPPPVLASLHVIEYGNTSSNSSNIHVPRALCEHQGYAGYCALSRLN